MKTPFAAVSLVTTLSACGGGSFNASPTPTPNSGLYACFFGGSLPTLTLVSPEPGATNVPDTTNSLVFSGSLNNAPVSEVSIKMTDPQGEEFGTNVFAPTGTNQYTVTFPAGILAPATTYTVTFVVQTGESAPCNAVNENLGSFTTQ